MLALSLEQQKSLVINDDVVVTVLGIHDGIVRLGIEAPREMPVHRGEVHEVSRNREGPVNVG